MLLESVIITAIIAGVSIIAYALRLAFMSKCKKFSCLGGVVVIERSIESEHKNVSAMRLPIGNTL